jgi:hypothetical protein
VETIEDLADLELQDKYSFAVGWYRIANVIHVIWRYESEIGTCVYVADNPTEAAGVFCHLVTEKLDDVGKDNREEMIKALARHGGPGPTWTNR